MSSKLLLSLCCFQSLVLQSTPRREPCYLSVNYLLLKKAGVGVGFLRCKRFHMSFHSRSRVKFWLLPWKVSARSRCLTYLLLFPNPLSWWGYPCFFPFPSYLSIWTWESISPHSSLLSSSERAPRIIHLPQDLFSKDRPNHRTSSLSLTLLLVLFCCSCEQVDMDGLLSSLPH